MWPTSRPRFRSTLRPFNVADPQQSTKVDVGSNGLPAVNDANVLSSSNSAFGEPQQLQFAFSPSLHFPAIWHFKAELISGLKPNLVWSSIGQRLLR